MESKYLKKRRKRIVSLFNKIVFPLFIMKSTMIYNNKKQRMFCKKILLKKEERERSY